MKKLSVNKYLVGFLLLVVLIMTLAPTEAEACCDVRYTVRYLEAGTGKNVAYPKYAMGRKYRNITEYAPNIPGYKLVDSYSKTIKLTANPQRNEIVFVYGKEKVDVNYTIRYVDENNADITNPVTKTGKVGDKVSERYINIADYEFVGNASDGNITLSSDSSNNNIVFRYKKSKVKTTYQMDFVDKAGNKLIDSIVKEGYVGEEVREYAKYIPGYKSLGNPIDGRLILKEKDNLIVFVYEKIVTTEKTNYTIKYMDLDKNISIKQDYVGEGEVGETVSLVAPAISGYEFVGNEAIVDLTLTDNLADNEVIFNYREVKLPDESVVTIVGVIRDSEGNREGELFRVKRLGDYQVGDLVNIWPLYRDGYVLKDFKTKELTYSADPSNNIVEFDYHKISNNQLNGTYLIRYVDFRTGKDIIKPVAGDGLAGASTTVTAEDIAGYRLVSAKEVSVVPISGRVMEIVFMYM